MVDRMPIVSPTLMLFNWLIMVTVLRMAVENGEGSLDKEATSHDDYSIVSDCLRCFSINLTKNYLALNG